MCSDFSLNNETNEKASGVKSITGRPGGSVGNLETFGRWDVSSNLGAVTRTGIFPRNKKIKKCPTSGERLFYGYTKFDFTVDEGKERLNPSREKNEGNHRRRKVEKSCLTILLCDPGWYVHKADIQNKWDDNTHTHTKLHGIKI